MDRPQAVADTSLRLRFLVDLDPVVLLRVAAAISLPVSLLQLRVQLVRITGTLVALLQPGLEEGGGGVEEREKIYKLHDTVNSLYNSTLEMKLDTTMVYYSHKACRICKYIPVLVGLFHVPLKVYNP